MSSEDDLLTNSEVAKIVRVKPCTPPVWRHRGVGPKWFKLGDGPSAPVRYRRGDVLEWLISCGADSQKVSA
jgi:hypothetical protein